MILPQLRKSFGQCCEGIPTFCSVSQVDHRNETCPCILLKVSEELAVKRVRLNKETLWSNRLKIWPDAALNAAIESFSPGGDAATSRMK
jgi:hypothetical protein